MKIHKNKYHNKRNLINQINKKNHNKINRNLYNKKYKKKNHN